MAEEITEWITADEAARRLGAPKRRISKYVYRRKLRKQPDAPRLMVAASDVEAMRLAQPQNAAPEEEGWITAKRLARMFDCPVRAMQKCVWYQNLSRKAVGRDCYYRIEEAEAALRDPDRLRREANRERLGAMRKALWQKPADAIDVKEAARRLDVAPTTVVCFAHRGYFASYRDAKGHHKFWLSAAEVEQRRARREWEHEKKEYNEAFPVEKMPRERTNLHPLLPTGGRVGVGDLSEWERHFGDWITTRQVAWMLNVTMGRVRALRCCGRLTGRKQDCWFRGHETVAFPQVGGDCADERPGAYPGAGNLREVWNAGTPRREQRGED